MAERLSDETWKLILGDLVKAAEYASAAKNFTLEAIASRHGCHKRTIQKKLAALGVEHEPAQPLRTHSVLGVKIPG
jgi:hypothetical protein